MKSLVMAVQAASLFLLSFTAESHPLKEELSALSLPEGWANTNQYKRYDTETLFNYINGESETFFPYGFQELTVFHLNPEAAPAAAVEVQIYEMRSPLGAFGIYSTYRAPGDEFVEVGNEGFIGTTQVVFYQREYFVKLHFVQPRGDRDVLLRLAEAVSTALPDASGPPEALALLEAAPGVEPKSIKYQARSLMGYTFFPRGFQAEAPVEGEEESLRLTVVICESEEKAEEALAKYLEDLSFFNAQHRWEDQEYGKVLVISEPAFERAVATRSGEYIAIVSTGPEMPELPNTHLQQLVSNIEKHEG